jgi:hypothetical protein
MVCNVLNKREPAPYQRISAAADTCHLHVHGIRGTMEPELDIASI